jgi:nitrogen regulatory protein PII
VTVKIDRDEKLITCILPACVADDVVDRLYAEGLVELGVSKARGMGHLTPRAHRRAGSETENEILSVVVPGDRADEIFRLVFDVAKIDRPHGGIMFMSRVMQSTRFELPEME